MILDSAVDRYVDLRQAEALLRVLLEDQPDDVRDAWADLVARGPGWRRDAVRSLGQLPAEFRRAVCTFLLRARERITPHT